MKLLGIDTALNACSVAIIDGDAVLARVVSPGGRGNAERLLPVLEQARAAAGLALADLDGIVATIGPGSFTGIRTALATARALGLALGKPVWGVTTTQALAVAAARPGHAVTAARPGHAVTAVIDARRGEVYGQSFDAAGIALHEPQLLRLADAAAALPAGPLLLVGSGSALLKDASPRRDLVLSDAAPDPDPVIVARLALGRPVISTYIAGIPELVDEGCGWIVPAGDVEALTEAMRDALAASPEKLAVLGSEGRARVEAAHDVDKEAEKLRLLFGDELRRHTL